MTPFRPMLVLCLSTLLLSCSRPAKTVAASQPAPPDIFAEAAPHSREANDAGRFLAGLPGAEGSPFADLETQEAWKVHRRELDRAWSGIETKSLPAMQQFQAKELSAPAIVDARVFYPFSGPDALMLTVFFPRNPVYVMVALEPPGTLPTAKHFAKKDLGKALAGVRETVSDELHRSFFITRQMDRQFRGQVTDGLLPPILLLLVRSGHTIQGYRYVQIDHTGQIIPRGTGPTTETGNKGVQVDFVTDSDGSAHRLYYFSTNLADQRLKNNTGFLAFMAEMKGATTYFKATSYMTHKPEFSEIRDQVLAKSVAVLQDDSGIPYRYFEAEPWHVQLYGEYERPYGSFRWLEQKDLRKAYDTPGTKPLPFQIGYGFRKAPSNLLFARKGDLK
ncbi:conserved exported hypothetical protein [Candidatus Sulfopaludibacter sp. SbA4]|nr:conserved exported hypothetical protein [Candidatus Sulfopaludibacter sp. SbA4]